MKVAFLTLGCKVNSYETEAVWELLEQEGYERVDFNEKSDIYIINTCSVTNNGESKSRKMIRHAISQNQDSIVVVMGCFSQLKSEEVLSIPGVSIAVGTNHRDQIPYLIKQFNKTKTPINYVNKLSANENYDHLTIHSFVKHQRAFLKIQDGCNNFCSYCIIPYARGRVRSKRPEDVINEADNLVKMGFKEIILTGIHTGGYGQDLISYRFSDLLNDLINVEGLKRLRISSIEISELTDDVMKIIQSSNIIVNHLHIPLQSGSERILKLMNRKYTKNEYLRKIESLRLIKDNLSVTTDIIVGFPGETEEDFKEACEFVKKISFQELHVFPYSKRDGTVAAKMPDQIDGVTKKDRVARLIEIGNQLSYEYAQNNVGKILQIIPESYKSGYLFGHSSNYLMVKFMGDSELIGQLVDVLITKPGYPENEGILA